MTIRTREMEYDGAGGPFAGTMVWDDGVAGPRPGVLVFPNVLGPKPFDVARAERLARLGYAGFVADVYGKAVRPVDDRPAAMAAMAELNADRGLLQHRIVAALETLRAQDEVDAARIAAIGFCFGGKCVLDLARSGAGVDGVASFHGVYDPPPYPVANPISAKVLVLHGWEDPIASPAQTVALAAELTAAGADWQIHAYGHTGHGFTAPGSVAPGIAYQADADRRSWQALENFLGELWGQAS